jgi:hypothetical protein
MLLQQLQPTRLLKKGGKQWLEVTDEDDSEQQGRVGKDGEAYACGVNAQLKGMIARVIGQCWCMRNQRR